MTVSGVDEIKLNGFILKVDEIQLVDQLLPVKDALLDRTLLRILNPETSGYFFYAAHSVYQWDQGYPIPSGPIVRFREAVTILRKIQTKGNMKRPARQQMWHKARKIPTRFLPRCPFRDVFRIGSSIVP